MTAKARLVTAPEAVYTYTDERDQPLFEVLRYPGKHFVQRQLDGHGGYIYNLDGVRRVPYRLNEVALAEQIFVVEGEKDVESLRALELVATTNPGGVNGWRPEYAESLRGKHVVILPDQDTPGQVWAQRIESDLAGVSATIKIINLPGLEFGAGADVSDWLAAGHTKQELLALVETARLSTCLPRRMKSGEKAASSTDLRVHLSEVSNWPDPAPLGDELPRVQDFTLELLPSSFRPLIGDISERMQTPLDYAATAAIVALAGCVNRRATIQPKAEDTSWLVVPNLWGAIIAPPGLMKSPVLRAVTLPLINIEEIWRAEYAEESSEYQLAKEQAELRWQAWREEYKRAIKKNETVPVQPDKTICAPVQKRLVLTDATFEKLHEILSENPAGILVVRDELTGWLAELDREGRQGERAFFLQAWNGDGPFTIDRIGRGSIYVPAVCVSLLGNIQPARLRWYLSQALEGGPSDDGLFQRFQILVWPDPPRDWRLIDRPPNAAGIQKAEQVYSRLATNLSADNPVRLRFDPESQALFFAWWEELEKKVRSDSGLAPVLVAHLAKYRSLMPTLAALFELADLAASGGNLDGEVLVDLNHARQAGALCDYLESHARRVYSCVVSPECRAARELARHIKSGDLHEVFTTRSIYLKGWTGLDTPERVRGALELLEDAGWLCRAQSPPSSSGGRPSEVWMVNPKVVCREK